MNRREALSRAAILLGAAISAPTIAALLSGCKADPKAASTSSYLTAEQEALLNELCDLILPKTSTPSATEVGVPSFIHAVMQDCTPQAGRDAFVAGLKKIDEDAKGFSMLSSEEKVAFLKKLDTDARAAGDKATPTQSAWRKLKELTVVGYFTSEIGAGEVLEYVPVPGRWDGCIP
ncbi:MAG: gluconate 2-dehydrogenase subunit 3 family protein, partial [Bacteroidetes bacterium]|nr:gluconate 2-dehydrogenase subunit 3 family protein [Bacteroidota bacterium]